MYQLCTAVMIAVLKKYTVKVLWSQITKLENTLLISSDFLNLGHD